MGDPADPVSVVVVNDDGHLLGGPETMPLQAAAGRAEGRKVTVLLPAHDIVCCLAKVPASSPARLRQMLPFSLEDEFAGDVDDLHFAAGRRTESGALAVSVIGGAALDACIEALKNAGIDAKRICSEADAVPDTSATVTLFLEGAKLLGRRANGAPFAFDHLTLSELWPLLEAEQKDNDDLDHVVAFVDREAQEQRRDELDAWRQSNGESGFDVDIKECADGCLPKLAAGMVFEPGTNLLQGAYSPRSSASAMLRPWRIAASLVVFFLAFSVLGKGAEYFKLDREQDRLEQQASSICAQSYGSAQLSRCLVEMGRRLAGSGQSTTAGGQGFLSMLAAVAGSLDAAMSIEGIGYRDGVLTLELIAPNVGHLDGFDQRLSEGGRFALDIQNTVPDEDGSLSSRVRIVAQNAGLNQ
jgi:general secretion pathway protein L